MLPARSGMFQDGAFSSGAQMVGRSGSGEPPDDVTGGVRGQLAGNGVSCVSHYLLVCSRTLLGPHTFGVKPFEIFHLEELSQPTPWLGVHHPVV